MLPKSTSPAFKENRTKQFPLDRSPPVLGTDLDLKQQGEKKCLITQSGVDGIGHQIEGKLSCMAMASFVGLEYVHKPFITMQHVKDWKKMAAFFEKFFGFGTQFRSLNRTAGRMKEFRKNVPWVGHCKEVGWMRKVELGQVQCEKDDYHVTSMDNCWDRMYCHGYMESGHFYKLVPYLHRAYFSTPKPDPNWTQGFSGQMWGPKVAVHIRQGDSKYQLKLSWYAVQIEELRKRFRKQDASHPPLFRVQTDAANPTALLKGAPELNASDIVIDGSKSSPLELAIHRMITADALIMSRSSLSISMALIGNQSIVIQPDCWDRTSLPHWTKATCALTTTSTTTTSAMAAPPRGIDLKQQGEKKCLITQSGVDGIGHQIEGKLSCMAMASFVGLEYVHKPFITMQHVKDWKKMAAFFEKFFGFGTQFRSLNRTAGRMKEFRKNVPWVGHCKEVGWMRKVELGQVQCEKDDYHVTSMDNCWDRMYCHGYMESGHFYKLVPYLHRAYFSTPKPDPNWTQGFSGQMWGPKVAVHIRQGDSKYQLKLSWYAVQIEELRKRFRKQDASHPPLFRVQTDAANPTALLKGAPELNASDIVIDGSKSSPLELAIHRMITADALIMSRSSLSISMALIGNQSIVIQPDCWDRTSLPHWTKKSCK